jgi:hypothetical protein
MSEGECGGAMQQSTCPECGEVVGGGAHRLAADNAPAAAFLAVIGAQAPPEDFRRQAEIAMHIPPER